MPARARTFLAVLAACCALPGVAAAQLASPQFIDGSPLDVYADGDGAFQVVFDGRQNGELAPPQNRNNPSANAGLNLLFYNFSGQPGPTRGFLGAGQPSPSGGFTTTQNPTLEPQNDGSVALRSTYTVPSLSGFTTGPMQVTERLFYRNGEDTVRARYDIQNIDTSGTPRYRVFVLGDTFHDTASDGGGTFTPGPPRAVGTYNHALGAGIDVRDAQNPWDVHEANPVDQLFSDVRSGTGFDNSVGAGPFDDAVGVQWNDFQTTGQPSGNVTVFEVLWRFGRSDALALAPVTAARTQGETHTVTAQLQPGSTAAPNRTLVYSVDGANPTSGMVAAGADGQAAISWTGANAGTDTLTAFWDATGDGVRQAHEAQEQATVEWAAPPPPPLRRGETMQVGLVEGTVLIADRLPSARGARAGVAQLGRFRRLTGIERIRVGSVLDTRRGTVRLTTARNRLGTVVQRGNFKGSRFRVRQSASSPLTTLRMRGGSFSRCKRDLSRGAAHTAQRRTIRRLRGSARGRFRTRGRHSSATVRGTRWIMEDRCEGTLTVVRDGSVRVRDFSRRRTVTVRAGRRYLARVARRR